MSSIASFYNQVKSASLEETKLVQAIATVPRRPAAIVREKEAELLWKEGSSTVRPVFDL